MTTLIFQSGAAVHMSVLAFILKNKGGTDKGAALADREQRDGPFVRAFVREW